jgi:SAM-dependent methyltransferase
MDERLLTNRDSWDEAADLHVDSPAYDLDGFRAGGNSLLPIEREELGDVAGLNVVHLMCHIGVDTLSLARLGARVTGVDFSSRAIGHARRLAAETGLEAEFHCANVYDVPRLDLGQFDLVFMNMGVLCWLPDVPELMRIVRGLLRPTGEYYLLDGHPVAEMLEPGEDGALCVQNGYSSEEAIRCECEGTYAAPYAHCEHRVLYEWCHPVSEVLAAIAEAGMDLQFFREHYWATFQRWPMMVQTGRNRWEMPPGHPAVPLTMSLKARVS